MFIIHEGEIIHKEKFGSGTTQRFYVKPPEQANVVIVDEEKSSELTNLFTRIFLPQGYPHSVSSDYTNYQIWDTAQAFCSTITGTLATQEVLRGVGVGDNSATPLAATITWVLKDGCGHLGKIFFAYSHGTHLDAHSKRWRLYADIMNDAAMCIEIALPALKNYTTIVLCVSTVMKAIVGVAGGATRIAMTQHHAIRGNLADVSAKDSAQETAVNLVASITALLIITMFGNSTYIFMLMVILHIIFNYFAVRSVCLKTLNETRFLQVIDMYIREEVIARPCEINHYEPLILSRLGNPFVDRRLCGFRIYLGQSMKKLVKRNPKAHYMKQVNDVYQNNNYIIHHSIETRKIYVYMRDTATPDDMLCSYFHAVLYGIVICAINDIYLAIYKSSDIALNPFPVICETLRRAEWSKESMEKPCNWFNYEPSIQLMEYLNDTVNKEWPRIREGLELVGWDLEKHLLLVNEWRVCTAKLVANKVSIGDNIIPEILDHVTSEIITFSENRDQIIDDSGEVRNYTIEPDNVLDDTYDSNLGLVNNKSEQKYTKRD